MIAGRRVDRRSWSAKMRKMPQDQYGSRVPRREPRAFARADAAHRVIPAPARAWRPACRSPLLRRRESPYLNKAAVLLCFTLLALWPGGCSRTPTSEKLTDHNVLIITLDTTRADRVGCYGYATAETPTLDAIARRGTLFERALAQVPLTLPSHASMMTGRYPREHGVRNNGGAALGDTLPTLAEKFREHGHRTAAFVAAFVLDSHFGVDRGFEVYSDDMGAEQRKSQTQALEWQISADVVADRALRWLESDPERPFFCWVHFYDAHDPYAPPPEFRKEGRHPYDGELAFMDSQIKRLTDWLEAHDLGAKTLIVVVGDHGEAFGEHQEQGHTNFVYGENVHVPMLYAHPDVIPAGHRVKTLVETVDIFPTLLDLFGWTSPEGLLSRSLAPAFQRDSLDERGVYCESLYCLYSFHWAEQRGLTTPRWKYVSSTKPELFDLQADPAEKVNLIDQEPAVAEEMLQSLKARYLAMKPGKAKEAAHDVASREALSSLGYVGGLAETSEEQFLTPGLTDPRDKHEVMLRYRMAKILMEQRKDFVYAIPLLEANAEECPDSHFFQYVLGYCCLRAEQPAAAYPALLRAVELDPTHVQSQGLLLDVLVKLGRVDDAVAQGEKAIERNPGSGELQAAMAAIFEKRGDKASALAHLRKAVQLTPSLIRSHAKLCAALDDPGEVAAAIEAFVRAVRKHPDDADGHFGLGGALLRIQRTQDAVVHFREAVRLRPDFCEAMLNLGINLISLESAAEAQTVFEQASTTSGCEAQGLYHLGKLAAMENRIEQTVGLMEAAIAKSTAYAPPFEELAQYYMQERRVTDAMRVLRAGVDADDTRDRLVVMLGRILSMSSDPDVRDGPAAVALLERAAIRTKRADPAILVILAAGYAESGRFDLAITAAEEAIAKTAGMTVSEESMRRIREQLDGYRRSQPARDPAL